MSNPFINKEIRDWYFTNFKPLSIPFNKVSTIGSGPFAKSEFDKFLNSFEINDFGTFEDINKIIVGRYDWEEETLNNILRLRNGKKLYVYSQEMFLIYLLTKKDPFNLDRKLLLQFAVDHPALIYFRKVGFDWPKLIVSLSKGGPELDWPDIGFLGMHGYTVERNCNLNTTLRRATLDYIFSEVTTKGNIPYENEWWEPNTPQRFQKIVWSIASFITLAQRKKHHKMDLAISLWKSDLEWLKNKYYKKLGCDFKWPDRYFK